MSAPNLSTLYGRAIVEELVTAGVSTVCVTPGSRSTPLTAACVDADDLEVFSHLDERASAFFALGHARRTGRPVGLVCTSGTAAANFHPAVLEADEGRVPLVVLTADRPPELRDSGANQTVDQVDLYGTAVRHHTDLPVPDATPRTLRSVRRSVAIAVAQASAPPAGPVHLNCPFRKPLEPTPVEGAVPDALEAARERTGPFVKTTVGTRTVSEEDLERVAQLVSDAERPVLVAGPADPGQVPAAELVALARRLDAPLLADPASGVRFGPHVGNRLVCGGYDAYVPAMDPPDIVLRVGDAPTSKRLRSWLRDSDADQILLDPGLEWREATFTATELIVADPATTLRELRTRVASGTADGWRAQFEAAEAIHWDRVDAAVADGPFEGGLVARVLEHAPPGATVTVSNSTPIRDADRFGRPRSAPVTVVANRGASGIDGVTSTGLGAAAATDGPAVLLTGDLAFYHDTTGLAAVSRCSVDCTIVVIDNGGGGIFHMLPIADFDPPFTEYFKTPHDVDLAALCAPFDVPADTVSAEEFPDAYQAALEAGGTRAVIVTVDAAEGHRIREHVAADVVEAVDAKSGS